MCGRKVEPAHLPHLPPRESSGYQVHTHRYTLQISSHQVHTHQYSLQISSHQVQWIPTYSAIRYSGTSLHMHMQPSGTVEHPHLSIHLVQWFNAPIQPSSTMRHPDISRHLVRQYTAIYPAIRYSGTPSMSQSFGTGVQSHLSSHYSETSPPIQPSGTVVQITHRAIRYNVQCTMRQPDIYCTDIRDSQPDSQLVRQYTAIYTTIRYSRTPPSVQPSGTVVQRNHSTIRCNETISPIQASWSVVLPHLFHLSGTVVNPPLIQPSGIVVLLYTMRHSHLSSHLGQ